MVSSQAVEILLLIYVVFIVLFVNTAFQQTQTVETYLLLKLVFYIIKYKSFIFEIYNFVQK
mgnify:CR=1 FL=1